jgi:mannose-6-phosphate isomerase-like protein (cupin superfamily)
MRVDGGDEERALMMSSAFDFEIIAKDGTELCYIIRAELAPDATTFVTPPDHKQQVGFIAYPAGGEVQRHLHLPLERHLVGTSEVLFVRKGRCVVDVYDDAKELVASREVKAGDVVLMIGGGHGFRMLEDTLFLEVKQGPYLECEEKERF